MIRRLLRIGIWLGLAAAAAIAVSKLLANRDRADGASASAPAAPGPQRPEVPSAPAAPWVEPADGTCPASHPIKAKLSSRIYHVPGSASYERTRPDRCYADAAAAEADGLRPAKR